MTEGGSWDLNVVNCPSEHPPSTYLSSLEPNHWFCARTHTHTHPLPPQSERILLPVPGFSAAKLSASSEVGAKSGRGLPGDLGAGVPEGRRGADARGDPQHPLQPLKPHTEWLFWFKVSQKKQGGTPPPAKEKKEQHTSPSAWFWSLKRSRGPANLPHKNANLAQCLGLVFRKKRGENLTKKAKSKEKHPVVPHIGKLPVGGTHPQKRGGKTSPKAKSKEQHPVVLVSKDSRELPPPKNKRKRERERGGKRKKDTSIGFPRFWVQRQRERKQTGNPPAPAPELENNVSSQPGVPLAYNYEPRGEAQTRTDPRWQMGFPSHVPFR